MNVLELLARHFSPTPTRPSLPWRCFFQSPIRVIQNLFLFFFNCNYDCYPPLFLSSSLPILLYAFNLRTHPPSYDITNSPFFKKIQLHNQGFCMSLLGQEGAIRSTSCSTGIPAPVFTYLPDHIPSTQRGYDWLLTWNWSNARIGGCLA